MAWKRTALALLGNGALLVRAALESRATHLAVIAFALVLAAVWMAWAGFRRQRALASALAPPSPHAGLVALTVAAVWLACGAAVVVIAG